METNGKAIKTVYHGYQFRSRLEARWAVYFDTCGWNWEYEPEGYDLNGTYYLPDFMLHDVWDLSAQLDKGQNQYVGDLAIEVKGVMTEEDYEKVRLYQKYIGPILVLGNIPNGNDITRIFQNINEMSNGLYRFDRYYIYRSKVHECTKCDCSCFVGGFRKYLIEDRKAYRNEPISEAACPFVLYTEKRIVVPSVLSSNPSLILPAWRKVLVWGCADAYLNNDGTRKWMHELVDPKAVEAFTAARQARFEHGETPRTFNHSLTTNNKFDWDAILNE